MRKLRVRIPLGTEVGLDVHVVLHDGRHQRVVHLLVPNEMHEGVNPRVHEIHGVGVVEHVRVHLQRIPVALVDNHPEEIGRQPGRAAVSVVDPDFDQVHLPGGQFANRLPRLVFSRHFIGNPGVGRTTRSRVRRADAAAGDEQTRAAQLSCFLVGTNLEGDVALFDALRLDDRDSVVQRPVEIVDEFSRVKLSAL